MPDQLQMTQTASNNMTVWLEDGVRVYPCRCGETHRGEWAAEKFLEHVCDHDEIVLLGAVGFCTQCGKPIRVT